MCLYPKLILNRKYLPNKKNKGHPPTITDERTRYVPIGCGKCMECLRQKSRGWQVRLHEELRNNRNAYFVTLSFSDESLNDLDKEIDERLEGYERENKIATLAVRRFLERYRKRFQASIRHWLVTELGQKNTERLHLHGIIWLPESKENATNIITQAWKYGNIWIGDYVNEKTVNYIVKYINKVDTQHKYYVPKVLCSKGIGSNYINRYDSELNRYNKKKTNELYTTRNGIKLRMPIYYRNKIYTDEEREMLWINLLDEQTRYVNGIKIDVSKDESDYFAVLELARLENKRLGYGDDKIDWSKKRYEQELRNLKRLKRLGRSG